MKKERGITLVALIVTIIILVILSAITIQNTIGENGLIDMAIESAIRSRIAEYKDELDQIGIVIMTENIPNNLTTREYLEDFKKKVESSELFKDRRSAEIIGKEEGEEELKLRIVTKEGFVYDVTEEETKYVGSLGDEGFKPLPDLKDPKIEIKPSETEWVDHSITATIEVSKELESFTIQYTTRKEAETSTEALSGWTRYNLGSNIDIETNETIFVRVIDNVGNATKTASKTISNIDRIVPDQPTDVRVTDTKTNSITVTATAKDAAGTDTTHYKEESGVAKIIFALQEEGEPQEIEATATGTASVTKECTFGELKQNKDYTITVKAVDKAGNESAIETVTQKTETVPGGDSLKDGAITFAYKSETTEGTDGWTKGPVNVTITSTYTGQGYTLQYTTKALTENDWHDYSGPVKMTTNGTIFARLKDSTNQTGAASTASGTVSNIDTTSPDEFTPSISDIKPTSFTITVSTKDTPSGIDYYDYYVDEKLYAGKSSSATCNVENQKDGMKHTVYVNAVDKAGNIRKSRDAEANLPVANVPPVIASVDVIAKTPDSLTIRANATDVDAADKTGLTYKVYIGAESTPRLTKSEQTQGADIDLQITELTEDTIYTYHVEVTDTANHTVNSGDKTGKTQCSGKTDYCSTGYNRQVKCTVCDGDGTIEGTTKCTTCGGDGIEDYACTGGYYNYFSTYTRSISDTYWCDNCGTYYSNVNYGYHVQCNVCHTRTVMQILLMHFALTIVLAHMLYVKAVGAPLLGAILPYIKIAQTQIAQMDK